LGRTGSGKSALLHRLIQQDAKAGYAVVVFDPGDLARDVYEALPASVLPRVSFFSLAAPIAYNPFARRRDEPARLENELFAIVDQTTAELGALPTSGAPLTPRMRRLLSYALRQVLKDPQANFSSLVTYLLEQRESLRVALELGAEEFAATWEGVVDRLSPFARDPRIRRVICSGHALDFGRVIDEGCILLVSLAGLEPALKRFLGTLLFNGLLSTVLERSRERRRAVAVYVDELPDFVASPHAAQNFQLLFNQGRKYRVSVTVAHTDFASVPEPLLHTIHGNAAGAVSFACGPEESRTMSAIFGGQWPPETIAFLPDYEAVARVGDRLGDNVYPIQTFPPPSRVRELADEQPAVADPPPDPFEEYERRHGNHEPTRRIRTPRSAPTPSPAI